MELAPSGGGGPAPVGTVPWPNIDLAALWDAGYCLGQQVGVVNGATDDVSGASRVVSAWYGPAADSWHGAVKTTLSSADEVSGRIKSAASALSGLFTSIETAYGQYCDAALREQAANQSLAKAQPDPKNPGVLQIGSLPWVLTELARTQAIADEQAAVDDAHGQAHVVANKLFGLATGLPANTYPSIGPKPEFTSTFVTTLLGSVVGDNRLVGIRFQDEVLEQLGLNENTKNFPPTFRTRPFRPDGIGGDDDEPGDVTVVVETKSVIDQYLSSQILEEIELAQQNGVPFRLVVGPKTQLTGPLQTKLQEVSQQQGEPSYYRYQGDGTYTNGETGEPVTPNPQTHGFDPVNTQPGNEDPVGGGAGSTTDPGIGGGGGADPGGGGDPDDPGGGDDPFDPDEPGPIEIP